MTDMENRDYTPIDIEDPYISLANSMRLKLESLFPLSPQCSIYRVSDRLRLANEKAYTPQVVSIGPLHHGKQNLKAMEEHKQRYLQAYLHRTNKSLEFYIQIIKEKEAKLRGCYAEPIGFTSDELTEIVLVDTAFIIEVLLRKTRDYEDENDNNFNKPRLLDDIFTDLLLLENQLPFFMLEDLFDKGINNSGSYFDVDRPSIIKLSHKFFTTIMNLEGVEENSDRIYTSEIRHFVDLLRELYVPKEPKVGGVLKTHTVPSMTELNRAGVKFKAVSNKNLFDISFSNGILEIPKFTLTSDETELILRNLLAFEQYHYKKFYLNDYVVIMDRLINGAKDVDLLVKYEVFESMLGDSTEGATLVNKLAVGAIINPDDFYFADVCEDLNDYCRTPWNTWKANLKQNYFNTPWATVSVIAAAFLLILTFMQSVCSIISVT